MCAAAKKWFRYAAIAYLAFAVIRTFAFSATDGSLEDKADCPLFLTAGEPRVDCLAISPSNDIAPARQILSRIIIPQIILVARAGLVCGAVKAVTKIIPKTSKNTIILKLRI
ncbi:MAG: hypothetical protein Pg6C_13400 [Treponemataceae bacterium]|nr:MAG: hypothetical protein Pg6C_13400 [Treponemataceae bacterium]